nr:zinc finger protein 862-like [Lytechinus pictus]
MNRAKYISILVLVDSSTDSSNKDLELIYLRFVDAGVPVNVLLGLEELKHATAVGHLGALQAGVEKHIKDWRTSVVGLGTNGAATIVGKDRGLAALIQKEVPGLCNVHCMAHRLEHGVADALKKERQMQQVITMLEGIYKTFKSSPKAWQELS